MKTRGIVIIDAGPLKALAYAGRLDLLLAPGIPVYISDMAIRELRNGIQLSGNALAIEFIEANLGKGIDEVDTGVSAIAGKLKELGEDPADVSIRRLILRYDEAPAGEEFAFLVSEDDRLLYPADPEGNTYFMTTRQFLQELEMRGVIEGAELLLQRAETAAIEAGERDKVLEGAKRERQAQDYAAVRSGERSAQSTHLINREAAKLLKVKFEDVDFD